ncbi:protein adenylyltransferase SelO [Cyclobacterium marinum]|uniref:protein adenylyltransferase SelO n=1 Tax=Cyclobacterium marinum TaxID=104 RepID=UPI0030DC16CB|tara:strand:- start:136157 stop:137746 length:1590 start_codon:yes stop_codon:yes gene_type:complete
MKDKIFDQEMKLNIQDTFTSELPEDPIMGKQRRQVTDACFSYVDPSPTAAPKLIHVSKEMLDNLGLTIEDSKSTEFLKVFTGNSVLDKTKPYAMCYGGHQFGNWAGQLGDGRAINLFEVVHKEKKWVVQLKGAGATPYSRTADGLAVLRSSIREYLCSEAMHHLGVPTTRALSLALTGDKVMRDVLYNGNPAYEKGAIVSRVSPSFLRFGNYELFASRQDTSTLKTLVDFTIKHHFSHLGTPSKETYIAFFNEVVQSTLALIVHWQRVGFVHGVMNTDNMSILGLTIDYGPYGWLEGFEEGWTPNTTDLHQKRYRYGNQPNIGLWNLYQLANALYPLIEEVAPLEDALDQYRSGFPKAMVQMMREKIGLTTEKGKDIALIQELERLLQEAETDMTIFFRLLSKIEKADTSNGLEQVMESFYTPSELSSSLREDWQAWFQFYGNRLQEESLSDIERKKNMNLVNPKYVLRNYMAQLVIDDAENGNYGLLEELFDLLKNPYSEQADQEKWFAKRPEWARHKVGCSMLSCSS